jgi:hypothetical protein
VNFFNFRSAYLTERKIEEEIPGYSLSRVNSSSFAPIFSLT